MTDSKNKFPVINIDKDYVLRELSIDDFKEFYDYFSDNMVNKYILSDIPKSLRESVDEIEYWQNIYKQKLGVYWAIARRDNNKLIGTIGLNNWYKYHGRVELSYDMAKEYWGKGIMSKAFKKVLEYGFNTMLINRIEAVILPENKDSFYLLQNNGFINEGTLRNYRFHNEKYYDLIMFSIIKSDFEKFRNKNRGFIGKFYNKLKKKISKGFFKRK